MAVCGPANAFAVQSMRSRRLQAISVMQDIATGSLIVFAASQPATLDISTPVLPLSFAKVFLAASWWDRAQPHPSPVDVHEMIVVGSDSAGRRIALALRQAVGSEAVLADLRRYGFNRSGDAFWAEIDPPFASRLSPPPAYARLDVLDDAQWSSALSIGETHMMTTVLHLSRFLQAVGNRGLQCSPAARSAERPIPASCIAPTRIVQESTAERLMAAPKDTVQRGSASRIAHALDDIGWSMGGKTGTGGRAGAPMDQQDGLFAGLVFDRQGQPRYTVATFVRRGGRGGGNAAEISAQLARFIIGGV